MGLDTFASRSPDDVVLTDDDLASFLKEGIFLCGGIFSGNGEDGSFRGKVYILLVSGITGVPLNQEWIPPETVRAMYESLMHCDPQQACEEYGFRNTEEDVIQLRKFFKVCVEQGLGLIGWF